MSRILIGALSGWKYHDRRKRCLDTWMADADEVDVRAVFMLGCQYSVESEQIGLHALALPCPDDYPSLPQRTMWFCRWALAQPGWDYIFKCDDDTYVSLPRLLAYDLAGRDYVGVEWKPGVAYASGGAGYFLSRRAAEIVEQRLANVATGAEDQEVGKVLRQASVAFSIEPRLIVWGDMARRPAPGNDLLTVHGVGAEVFMASHQETGHAASRPAPSSPL